MRTVGEMDDGSIENGGRAAGRTSRRAALKAGVGAGVGLVAWSGPTITSLGGTPAYAAGCTFVVSIDLSGGCRNTDQRSDCQRPSEFAYHTLRDTGLPDGFSLTNNVPEGTCCDVNHTPILTFPSGLTCAATIVVAQPPQCTGTVQSTITTAPSSTGQLAIPLSCPNGTITANSQYTIVANCTTTGADPECFE